MPTRNYRDNINFNYLIIKNKKTRELLVSAMARMLGWCNFYTLFTAELMICWKNQTPASQFYAVCFFIHEVQFLLSSHKS